MERNIQNRSTDSSPSRAEGIGPSRFEKETRFWERMEQAIGVIPRRVPHLLDLLEMSATSVIACEETDWVAHINSSVQDEGKALFDEAVKRGDERLMTDFFGRHANNLKAKGGDTRSKRLNKGLNRLKFSLNY